MIKKYRRRLEKMNDHEEEYIEVEFIKVENWNRKAILIIMINLFKIFYQPFLKIKKKRDVNEMLQISSLSEKFNTIYHKRLWTSKESVSGTGSTLEYTNTLREKLPSLIRKYNIGSVVDSPCGDFNWFKEIINDLEINYTGVDIVETLIEGNIEQYSSYNINFKVGNICKDRLPKCDLLIVRDCLFHLSHKDINEFLQNISDLDYKYLLTTSFSTDENFENSDIISGSWRIIDILKSPYHFNKTKVLNTIEDDLPHGNKKLILFHKNDVPRELNISA